MKKIILLLSLFVFTSAVAKMSNEDKSKALDCVGIYMANYFLPSGEKFEYGMKEKSISTVVGSASAASLILIFSEI